MKKENKDLVELLKIQLAEIQEKIHQLESGETIEDNPFIVDDIQKLSEDEAYETKGGAVVNSCKAIYNRVIERGHTSATFYASNMLIGPIISCQIQNTTISIAISRTSSEFRIARKSIYSMGSCRIRVNGQKGYVIYKMLFK